MKKEYINNKIILSIAAIFAFAGLSTSGVVGPAKATVAIAESPLYMANRIKPNFIMSVDDSGSMDFEVLALTNDGSFWWNVQRQSFFGLDLNNNLVIGREVPNFNNSGNVTDATWKKYSYIFPNGTGAGNRVLLDSTSDHFAVPPVAQFAWARSPDYNKSYFNPLSEYAPWKQFNNTIFPQINPTAAPSDPGRGTRTLNLTATWSFTGSNFEFMFMRGMVIPQGTEFRVSQCFNSGLNPTVTTGPTASQDVSLGSGWFRAAANRTVGITSGSDGRARCSIAVRFFPAQFWIAGLENATTVANSIGYRVDRLTVTTQSPGDADGNGRQTLYLFEIRPANFNSVENYNKSLNNFANWYSYYRKRHLAARAGITQAFFGFDFIRAGYFTINNRVNVTMRDLAVASDRQQFFNQVLSLSPSGGTPNREAVEFMGNQFSRTGVGAPIQLACQKNFGMLFTDGFSNPTGPVVGNVDGTMGPPFADAVSNTMADIAARHYLRNLREDLEPGKVPVPSQCFGAEPNIRLNCRNDPHMVLHAVILGSRGVVFDPVERQDAFRAPFPVWPTSFPPRSPLAVDDLWHATVNTRGRMLNANTPREIASAIRSVLVEVNDASLLSGRDSVSGVRVTADTFYVVPSFDVRNNGRDWSGSLIAYSLTSQGKIADPIWRSDQNPTGDAALSIPNYSDRNIVAITRSGTSAAIRAQQFSFSALGGTQDSVFNALGMTPADRSLLPGVSAENVVNYLRGDRTNEVQVAPDGTAFGILRERSTLLGNIVGSTPAIFTAKENFGYGRLPGGVGTAYNSFLSSRASRTTMVYVGSNDGMLHAFKGRTGENVFSVIPNGVIQKMGRLAMPEYQHTYFVDGQIRVADAQIGGQWGTVLVAGAGAGARSLFALNVTNATLMDESRVMWELDGRSNPNVGHIMGRPWVLPMRSGSGGIRWVVLVGNGYNSTSLRPSLLVIDVNSGAIISTLTPPASTAAGNGLGNIVAVPGLDGLVDFVYGGDLDGNVWKFDLRSPSPSSWAVGNAFFRATDAAGNPQPITGGFDVARAPQGGLMVFFGSGRYFVEGDNNVTPSSQVQTLYGVHDGGSVGAGTITRSQLAVKSITSQSTIGVTSTRVIPSTPVNYSTHRGWAVNLIVGTAVRGERHIAFPRVEGGTVFFTTFEPIGDACTPGGLNWLYGLSASSGSPNLQNINMSDMPEHSLCVGQGCGAVSAGSGAPVIDSVVTVPPPRCIPGSSFSCPSPVICQPGQTEGCTPESLIPSPDELNQSCVKIISVGGRQIVQPRPCGRQSWRQVR